MSNTLGRDVPSAAQLAIDVTQTITASVIHDAKLLRMVGRLQYIHTLSKTVSKNEYRGVWIDIVAVRCLLCRSFLSSFLRSLVKIRRGHRLAARVYVVTGC